MYMTNEQVKAPINPYLEVVLAAILWGSSGVFVKYLALPPTTISFFRLAVPTLLIALFLRGQGLSIRRTGGEYMLLASLLNAIRIFFYFVGFTYASVGNAVIMLYTWPIFASLLSVLVLKETISRRNVGLLLLAFGGILLIYLQKPFTLRDDDFLGMSAMLVSAFVYSLTVLVFKRQSGNYAPFETVYFQNLIGSIFFLPFLWINQPFPSIPQFGIAVLYAFLVGLVGFALFFSALRTIPTAIASMLAYTEVIAAVVLAVLLLDETLTWNMWAGGACVIGATLLLKR